MNEPIGLFGSFKPTLALLTALEIDFTASSCPDYPVVEYGLKVQEPLGFLFG